jgi:hypothetical protein
MASQTIILTALPNGISGTGADRKLKLSVFVSPRLKAAQTEGDTLTLFPDLLDWPARLQQASFKLQFTNGPTVDATLDKSKLDSSLWKALFAADSFVRPYVFDNFQGRPIISYPAKRIHQQVRSTYQLTASSRGGGWEGEFSGDNDAAFFFSAWEVEWNAATEAAALANLENANPTDAQARDRFLLFHRRPEEPPVQLPTDHTRTLDVHEAFTALSSYPELMRRLGLVLDLTVPASAVPLSAPSTNPPATSHVAVLATIPPAAGPAVTRVNRSPRTACIVSADDFNARPISADVVGGMLNLDDTTYDLVPVDIDGAALKLVNAGVNTARNGELSVFGSGPPELRSAGITLVRDNEASRIRSAFSRALTNNTALDAGQDVQLTAEDLIVGLRIDIFDEDKQVWRSLNQRAGSYTFERTGASVSIADEGYVEQAMAESTAARSTGAGGNPLYLHEALASWKGWSAAAPMPGRVGDVDPEATPVEQDNQALTQFKLKVSFKPVAGSLPTLRFGRRYRMRVRVVNLAGNSRTLADAPDVGFPVKALAYLRYDPIPPPDLALRQPIDKSSQPGETLTQIVLRTANTDPSKDAALSPTTAERHVLPPRADATFAVTHGVLDDAAGRPRADLYSVLATRDAAQIATDPASGSPIDSAPQASLKPLPDPLSRGPALHDLPGIPTGNIGRIDASGALVFSQPNPVEFSTPQVVLLDWGPNSAWPNPVPLRMVLRDGNEPPKWDKATRVLTVSLPKGRRARVPVSSYLREEDLKLMGIWEWLREAAEAEVADIFKALDEFDWFNLSQAATKLQRYAAQAVTGGNIHLTPPRRIDLIHAVQQPLGRPIWHRLLVNRGTGASAATFNGELQIHRATTASVALQAHWEETIDLPNEPAPRKRQSDVVVVDLPLPGDQDVSSSTDNPIEVGGKVLAQYDLANDRIVFQGGATPTQQFGDKKYRRVRYRAASTSRFREFFPPTAPGGFVRESDELIVDVPASERPEPPRLAYVLPTFAFTRQTDGNLLASTREGGQRAYFERPWFSSGDGERLAVVFARGDLDADRVSRMRPFVTLVGADPTRLGLDHDFSFPGTTGGETVKDLFLDGAPERVDIDSFPVEFDAERKLWFADFQMFLGGSKLTADPHIRLALARYQPNARTNRELSRVVLADFIQMPNSRSAVATFDPYNPAVVRLAVAGPTHASKANPIGGVVPDRTLFEVSVEMRRPHVAGELGWMPAPPSLAIVAPQNDNQGLEGNAIWTGTVTLPADRKPGDFRLVIKEFERFITDNAVAELGIGANLRPERLIYAETMEV